MTGIPCYRCNTNMVPSDEWKPFDFCAECKEEIAEQHRRYRKLQASVSAYWTLPTDRQNAIKAALKFAGE